MEGAKHQKFQFINENGNKTRVITHLSRKPSGTDLDANLQGKIARQMKLSSNQFREFVDCTLTIEEYRVILANLEEKK